MAFSTGPLPDWLVGVLFCLAGSTGAALGLIIQKYSHLRNEASEKPVAYLRQPHWYFGFALYMACQGLNLVAMGMAPLVVLSSLGAWCLISNALWARVLLGERLRCREVITMVGTVGGVILVIESTPSADEPFPGDVRRMNSAFTSAKFLGTTAGLCGMLVLLFLVTKCFLRIRPAIWALASAVFSGYTVMLWKCLSLLVVAPVPGAPLPWLRLEPYLIFCFGMMVGAGQVHTMNVGLKTASPLLVVPIFYTMGMLAQIGTGAVFFEELDHFKGRGAVFRFWGGTALCMVCIFFLTKFKVESQHTPDPVQETPEVVENPIQNVEADIEKCPTEPVICDDDVARISPLARGLPGNNGMIFAAYRRWCADCTSHLWVCPKTQATATRRV